MHENAIVANQKVKAYYNTYIFCVFLFVGISLCVNYFPLVWPMLFIPCIIIIWFVLKAKTTHYEISKLFVKVYSGVLNKEIETIDMTQIKDVNFSRSLFQRIFHISSIEIFSKDKTSPYLCIFGIEKLSGQQIFDFINKNAISSLVEYRIKREK